MGLGWLRFPDFVYTAKNFTYSGYVCSTLPVMAYFHYSVFVAAHPVEIASTINQVNACCAGAGSRLRFSYPLADGRIVFIIETLEEK